MKAGRLLGGACAPLAVTGMGVVSAAGVGVGRLRTALRGSRSHLSDWAPPANTPLRAMLAGNVADEWLGIDAGTHGRQRALGMASLALEEALSDANRCGQPIQLEHTGLAVGTALGPVEEIENWICTEESSVAGEYLRDISFEAFMARLSRHRAVTPGLGGPTSVFSATCVSGLCAMEQAAPDLSRGRARSMLVGVVDSLGCLMRGGFSGLEALAPSAHLRAFGSASNEDGIVVGEGACFLVLEPLGEARQRGARVHGRVLSQRLFSDSQHLVSPDPSGEAMTRAIETTLEDAGLRPNQIGCVTASAVGSSAYDQMLDQAFHRSLRGAEADIPITTFEPFVGHVLAAGGPLSLVHAALMLEARVVNASFPTEQVAPEYRLRYTFPNQRSLLYPFVLTVVVGFGGQNSVCVVAGEETVS